MKRLVCLFLFLLAGVVFSANEIVGSYTTGVYVYCRIIQKSTGYILDTSLTPDNYVAAPTWANSAVVMTESETTGVYKASMLSTSVSGQYLICAYTGTLNTPVATDIVIGNYLMSWSGSAEITPVTLYTLMASTGVYVDWSHVTNPTATVALPNTTVGTLTTYTGNTPQTGDSYAKINSSTCGLAALKALLDTLTLYTVPDYDIYGNKK